MAQVTKCDICKGEHLMGNYFVTVKGHGWAPSSKVDTEARMDICDECATKLIKAVEGQDTHVRSADKV